MEVAAKRQILEKIETFNKKNEGREVNWCIYNYIGNFINFNPSEITFCCSSTTSNYPVVCGTSDQELQNLNKESYILAMLRVIDANQDVGPCCGCQFLQKMIYPKLNIADIRLDGIAWNHFRGCNSKCVYCGDGDKFKTFYEPLGVVNRFLNQGFTSEKVKISWGGGEPTLLPNLEKYIDYGCLNNWAQILNTSGLICKDCIVDALKEGNKFEVQISVDSGSKETYKKVKGQSGYNLVWNTIQKYCVTGGKVYVKYILFSYNSEKKEIDIFMEKCISSGVTNIVVSGESGASWNSGEERSWDFGENEELAAAYFMDRIIENKMALFFKSDNFSVQNCRNILKKFVDLYLFHRIQDKKLCIWGMGMRGKKLSDCLRKLNIEIEYFGDSDSQKWGTYYDGILCRSLNELKLEIRHNQYYIIVAVEEYKEIYDRLIKEIPNTEICVWILY